ncbi:hypothetical protein ABIE67_002017 [Streptomyces sp. V4I8]
MTSSDPHQERNRYRLHPLRQAAPHARLRGAGPSLDRHPQLAYCGGLSPRCLHPLAEPSRQSSPSGLGTAFRPDHAVDFRMGQDLDPAPTSLLTRAQAIRERDDALPACRKDCESRPSARPAPLDRHRRCTALLAGAHPSADPDDWFAAMIGDVPPSVLSPRVYLRRFAAVQLVQIAANAEWGEAARFLGIPDAWHRQASGARPTADSIHSPTRNDPRSWTLPWLGSSTTSLRSGTTATTALGGGTSRTGPSLLQAGQSSLISLPSTAQLLFPYRRRASRDSVSLRLGPSHGERVVPRS